METIKIQKVTCEKCRNTYSYNASDKMIKTIDRILENKEFSCPKCKGKELKREIITVENFAGSSLDETTPEEKKEYEKCEFKTPSVKKLEKTTVTIMQPRAEGDGYHEVEITKNLWRCACGLVWEMRRDAEDCIWRGHKPAYQVTYGGYVSNGHSVGGNIYTIKAVRKDNLLNQKTL